MVETVWWDRNALYKKVAKRSLQLAKLKAGSRPRLGGVRGVVTPTRIRLGIGAVASGLSPSQMVTVMEYIKIKHR